MNIKDLECSEKEIHNVYHLAQQDLLDKRKEQMITIKPALGTYCPEPGCATPQGKKSIKES